MPVRCENGIRKFNMENRKHKRPTFLQNLNEYFRDYCNKTGIYCFKYIGEPNRTVFERIWWVMVFGFALYFCISFISVAYKKWDTSPVIVSFAQDPTPVWNIPFPAITICSETKSRQTKFNFTDAYHQLRENNISEEVMRNFEKVALVCDNHLYHEGNQTTGLDTIEYLKEIAPPFYDTLWQCKWTNKNETCDNMFSPMLTEEGTCFTFNMLDVEELFTNSVYLDENYLTSGRKSEGWTIEGGYPPDADKDTYPRRAMSAGTRAGLVILMRAFQQDLDYICRGPVQGFKILLHNPMEIPRVSTQYFRVPLNQEVVVSIRPHMITTSEALKNYEPRRRNCYLQSERHLLYFKGYTQQNCQLECLTNYTLKKCDCVAYHMPHDKATPICGTGSIECMRDAADELLAQEVEYGLKEEVEGQVCDCLPSCTSLSYKTEISQADFRWAELFNAYRADVNEFPGYAITNRVQMSRLTISFKEMQFVPFERNEFYGSTVFLANCGGLLSFFTGFSFVSVVEIVYFSTLRLFCNIRKFGKHFWSGSQDFTYSE